LAATEPRKVASRNTAIAASAEVSPRNCR